MRTLGFLLVLFSLNANAYVGAVSSATAESGRASVEATDSPFLNPASIPYLKGYFLSTGFTSAQSNLKNSRSQDFSVAVTDNLPDTVVPTALAFTQSKADVFSEEVVSRDFRLSLANIVAPKFAFGLGFRYKDDQIFQDRYNQLNMGFGALYAPNADLGFALTSENMISPPDTVPQGYRLQPSTAVGVSYIYRQFFRARGDIITGSSHSWDKPVVALGSETYLNRWVILRAGLQRRIEESANVYSGGFGFRGPKFGVHYAYLTSPQLESFARHTLDLAVPVW